MSGSELERIIYCSQARVPTSSLLVIADIPAVSQRNNVGDGLSGALATASERCSVSKTTANSFIASQSLMAPKSLKDGSGFSARTVSHHGVPSAGASSRTRSAIAAMV